MICTFITWALFPSGVSYWKAGVSLLAAMEQAGAQVCKGGTGSEELIGEMCDCYTRNNCARESEIAIMESEYFKFKSEVSVHSRDGKSHSFLLSESVRALYHRLANERRLSENTGRGT